VVPQGFGDPLQLSPGLCGLKDQMPSQKCVSGAERNRRHKLFSQIPKMGLRRYRITAEHRLLINPKNHNRPAAAIQHNHRGRKIR